MTSQRPDPVRQAGDTTAVHGALIGAGLALFGALVVEALVAFGLRPLGPMGWPGVGMIAAAALCGMPGFAGGAAVTAAYYLFNVSRTDRFPEFFATAGPSISWLIGLLIASVVVIALRARLRTAQMAAILDRSLRESETRFRHLTELSSDWYWEQDEQLRFTFISGPQRAHAGIDTDALLGRARWEFPALNMSEADWGRHRAQLDRHEPFRDLVTQRVTRDGGARWVAVSGDPVFDDFGRFKGYRGVGRDVTAQREAEQALRESEQWLRLVTENIPALVGYVDTAQRFRFTNRAYEDWFGLRRETLEGGTVREAWGDERYAVMRPNIERALNGERLNFEYNFRDRHGLERHVMANYVPDLDPGGKPRGFFVLGSDITTLAAARGELHAARERLERALEGSSAALWDTDVRTGRVYLSEAWSEILGQPRGATATTLDDLASLMHPDDVEETRRASLETMKGIRAAYAVEHRVRSRTGEWKWILSRGQVTERDPATGRALRMIGTNLDITERKRVEQALQSVAQIDPLTGAANRMLLMDRLRLAMARSRRSGSPCALLYLDIDRFKSINDTLGHAAGDFVLKDFAARLRDCVRQTDTVARLGGDEFVVLLEDLKDPASAARIAAKVLDAMRVPSRIGERELEVTTSIGIAHGAGDADEQAWLGRADAALYDAKNGGRNTYRVAR